MSLGSASFELLADNSQLTAAFIQAKAAAENASQAIAAAARTQAAAERESNAIIQAAMQQTVAVQTAVAQSAIKTAAQSQAAYQQQAAAAKASAAGIGSLTAASTQAAAGFTLFTKANLAAVGVITTFTAAIAASKAAVDDIYESTVKAQNAQFALNKAYGEAAPLLSAYAEQQARSTEFSAAAYKQAFAIISVLQKEGDFTDEQQKLLLKRAADLAAAFGKDLPTALIALENAFKGRAGALSQFGAIINQEVVKELGGLTEAEKKNFDQLPEATRLQAGYNAVMILTATQAGAAEEHLTTLGGATANLAARTNELAAALGSLASPELVAFANLVANMIEPLTDFVKLETQLAEAGRAFATQQGVPAWLQAILSATPAMLAIGALTAGPGDLKAPAGHETVIMHPTPAEVTGAIKRYEDLQKALAALRKETREMEAKAALEEAHAVHDRGVKALDDQKVLAEVERDNKIKAVEAAKDAALKGIEIEARAAAAASEAEIVRLHTEEEAAKRGAETRHAAIVAGLEAEEQATKDATEENLRQLEISRDADKQASEDRRDQAIANLEAEKRARDVVRTQEDRAFEDSFTHAKRLEDARHQAAIRGLDAEAKASTDRKDALLRDLDELATAYQKGHESLLRNLSDEADADKARHDKKVRAIEDEGQAAQHQHEAAVRAIEDEGRNASTAHDQVLRRISDEADAARAAHDLTVRSAEDDQQQATVTHDVRLAEIDAEGKAAKEWHDASMAQVEAETKAASDAHDAVLRELSDEGDAAKDVHDVRVRLIEDQGRAAHDGHDRLVRDIEDEGKAAQQVHDAEIRRISDLSDVENDHHRLVLDNLDAEQQRRQDAIDEQIKQLDDLDRAESQSARQKQLQGNVAGAQRDVQKAESTGNLSEIEAAQRKLAEAQQAILDDTAKNQRDATRQALQDQQDAIKAEVDARKQAEDDRHQILMDELAAEKTAADDRLALIKTELGARKDAADDALKQTSDRLDAEKRAADDEYVLIQKGLKDRKDAEDAAYVLIQKGIKDRKDAADAAYKLIQDDLQARKDAADAAYKLVVEQTAEIRQAADDALKIVLDQLAKQKTAEDDAFKQGQDRRDAEKRAIDDVYQQGVDRRAATKQQLDDQLKQALDRIDTEKRAEDDAYEKTKDRLDKRKIAIGDANKDELEKIAARKTAEDDAHDNAVIKAQDQSTQEKREIQDRRTAEDLADAAKRRQIQDTFELEARDRHARYDDKATGEIPALQRALDAYQESVKQRRAAADEAYKSEQQQITDIYNHPTTGLIPNAQRGQAAVATSFRDQATEVTASAASQKATITDLYNGKDPKKPGIITQIEDQKNALDQALRDQELYWQHYTDDIGGPDGKIAKIKKQFDDLVASIEKAGGKIQDASGQWITPPTEERPGYPGGPHGPRDPGGNAAYAPVVKHAGPGTAWTSGGTHGGHPAVDIMAPIGEPIYAPIGGRSRAAVYPLGGNTSQLEGDDGRGYYFAHGSVPFKDGRVEKGEQIGAVGDTGNARGGPPHVHFAISSHGTGLFSELNGSGDITGDASWWTTGAPGALTGPAGQRGQTFEFDLFGRHFSVTLPFGSSGSTVAGFREMVDRIRQAVEAYDIPPEVPAAIAGNEAGYGERTSELARRWHNWFGVKGSGDAGQTPPLSTWEDLNGNGREDPGERMSARFAAYSSDAAAFHDWARQFSTGRYAEAKAAYQHTHQPIDYLEGLFRAGYATDAAWVSKVRSIGGFANGGLIPEPTLLVGQSRGPYAIAGEMGTPEWVTNQAPGTSGGAGSIEHMPVNVYLGNQHVERIWIDGYHLLARRGGLPTALTG